MPVFGRQNNGIQCVRITVTEPVKSQNEQHGRNFTSFSGSKSLSLESLLSLSGSLVEKDINKVVRKILYAQNSTKL